MPSVENSAKPTKDCDTSSLFEDKTKAPGLFEEQGSAAVLVTICCVYFVAFSAFAVVAPFLYIEAARKGVSLSWSGWILASFPLISIITSPVIGSYLPRFGAKRILIIGCVIEGTFEIAFGFGYLMPTAGWFIVYTLVTRGMTSLGSSCTLTASLAMLTNVFPEHKSFVFSLTEIFTGLGIMTSPAYGGFLFQHGGFVLPFLVTGGAMFVLLLFVLFMLRSYDESSHDGEDTHCKTYDDISVMTVLGKIGVFTGATSTILTLMIPNIIDSTLSFRLQQLSNGSISASETGLFFLIMPTTFTITAVIVGLQVDKKLNVRYCILAGHILSAVTFLFMGPSPLLKGFLHKGYMALGVCLAFQGVWIAFSNVPLLADMHNSARKAGLLDTEYLGGIISGIFVAAMGVGNVLGPAVGSHLCESLGFGWSLTVISSIMLIHTIFSIAVNIYEWRLGKRLLQYRLLNSD